MIRFAALASSLVLFAACGSPGGSHVPLAGPAASSRALSNVARDDYAGSAACAPCHPSEFAAWQRSPMHRMTRDARDAEVRAPFDGTQWTFKRDKVTLEQRGADLLFRLALEDGEAKTYRVTRVIGGRIREDFAGVDEAGGEEVVLPVSYVLGRRAFRYKGYSVMVHERQGLRAGPVWSRTCIFCHNTVPEIDRILGAIAGPRAPPYQGQQVDRWLPEARRIGWRVVNEHGFSLAAGSEVSRLGETPDLAPRPAPVVAQRAIDSVSRHFDGRSLVEVGIGCEACHGGCREHVSHPSLRPSLLASAPWLRTDRVPTRALEINRNCARCHQVLFSRYPFTWEGGRRNANPGGSHINSGEARDFLLGGCSQAMACTACHDPHGGGGAEPAGALSAVGSPTGNHLCTPCHAALADLGRLRAHAHHDPAASGGSCIACHMPRKNMGLDGVLTRYHRIGSPTDAARVLGDRPIECALCHSDKTVRALVDAMQAWWPVRYPPERLVELYGSLDANVIQATLERGKPHEQAVAIATLGEAGARAAAASVASKLLSDYPLVREWAKRALGSIGACGGDIDLDADDATIAREAAKCGASPTTFPPVHGALPKRSADDEPSED